MPNSEPKGPLDGVRVLDLTQYIAGPTACRVLADLGAEVVKVEVAPRGDFQRYYFGGPSPDGYDPAFLYWNRGKQVICVDIKRPEGAEMVKRLARNFDVLIENYTPGVLAKYGFSYNALRDTNPRLIMCSISGFGQTGPMSRLPGNDTVAQAYAGLSYLTGEPQGYPVYTGMYIADSNAGINAAAAVMAALYHREKTGVGQYIDLSLVELLFQLHDTALIHYLWSGGKVITERSGSQRDEACPMGIYKATGGFVVLAVLSHQWQHFATVIGRPDLAADPELAELAGRLRQRFKLTAIVEAWLQSFPTRDAAVKVLQDSKLLVAPLLNIEEVLTHPQIQARDFMQPIGLPGHPDLRLPRLPYHFSETPTSIAPHLGRLGEHNQAVLGKYLGLTPEQVAELTRAGILHQDPHLTETAAEETPKGGAKPS